MPLGLLSNTKRASFVLLAKAVHSCAEMNYRLSCLDRLAEPRVARVGPRTASAREPRQVRKEAAAARYRRVADLSGSGDAFLKWLRGLLIKTSHNILTP